jgi:hypothetical protein
MLIENTGLRRSVLSLCQQVRHECATAALPSERVQIRSCSIDAVIASARKVAIPRPAKGACPCWSPPAALAKPSLSNYPPESASAWLSCGFGVIRSGCRLMRRNTCRWFGRSCWKALRMSNKKRQRHLDAGQPLSSEELNIATMALG